MQRHLIQGAILELLEPAKDCEDAFKKKNTHIQKKYSRFLGNEKIKNKSKDPQKMKKKEQETAKETNSSDGNRNEKLDITAELGVIFPSAEKYESISAAVSYKVDETLQEEKDAIEDRYHGFIPASPRIEKKVSIRSPREANVTKKQNLMQSRSKCITSLEIKEDSIEDLPLYSTWGIPRDQIIEYIKTSMKPSGWTRNFSCYGEWTPVEEKQGKSNAHASQIDKGENDHTDQDKLNITEHSLPPHSPKKERHIINDTLLSRSAEERSINKTVKDKMEEILDEFRTNPMEWARLEDRVREIQACRKYGLNTRDVIKDNRNSVVCPITMKDRKQKINERKSKQAKTKEMREIKRKEERKRQQDQMNRRNIRLSEQKRLHDFNLRQVAWLQIIPKCAMLIEWRKRFDLEKQIRSDKIIKHEAAIVIQRFWMKTTALYNSRNMLTIIKKVKKMTWRLLFKLKCQRKARAARLLRSFLLDFNSQNKDKGSFRLTVAKWRYRVISCQRYIRSFLICTKARIHVLSLIWDKEELEKQAQENNDEKVHDVSAHVGPRKRTYSNSPKRHDSAVREEKDLHGNPYLLNPVNKRQSVCVPRVPRSIKNALLRKFLSTSRKRYVRGKKNHEQRQNNKFIREIKTEDAKAIVENGERWNNIVKESHDSFETVRKSYFCLYTGTKTDFMKDLVLEGIQQSKEVVEVRDKMEALSLNLKQMKLEEKRKKSSNSPNVKK